MAFRKSSFIHKQELKTNKEKQNGSEDLYFDMEYPEGKRSRSGTQDSDAISFSSKSVESLGSGCTVDSQDSQDWRRGSSVGPILERPTSLRFTSNFKRNISSGSLPRSTQQRIPKFSFQNFSVPTTPADSWEQENNFLRKGGMNSSTSSVEEVTESLLSKTRSRLSLNLGVFDGLSSPGSPARSPRFIPKFLRSSFCKLMLKDKSSMVESSQEPMSLPFFGNLLSSSQNSPPLDDPKVEYDSKHSTDEDEKSPPSTPTTKLFVQESLAKGLPIIPFNYPTFVIVEKKRLQRRNGETYPSSKDNVVEKQDMPKEKTNTYSYSEPSSRKTSSIINQTDATSTDFSLEKKSLKKLLSLAKREMEEEAFLKKSSCIRGYAANNSRALQRRKSSVSEYVEMSIGKAKDIAKPSYKILENSAQRHSLNNCSSVRGNYVNTKSCKSKNVQEKVISSQAMQSSDMNKNSAIVECSAKQDDYLDMNCGRKQI
eukprot:GFUD01001938.1.p1 GENE.GFUD01001938.1~~GFUD01001938.1.p1  ORF type:complete len:483 (+),score=104.06 GFUD01001938.1:147-1595(+)